MSEGLTRIGLINTGNGNDTIINAVAGYGQTHVFSDVRILEGTYGHFEGGDDVINLTFAPASTEAGEKSNTAGHHVWGFGGNDTFNFQYIDNVNTHSDPRISDTEPNSDYYVITGRIDDFDSSRDKIQIEGIDLDLNNLPSNVSIIEYNGEHQLDGADAGARPQLWILIETGNGAIFYALEGSRIDLTMNGKSQFGHEERHFVNPYTEMQNDGFSNLKDWIGSLKEFNTVNFTVLNNAVPDGVDALGGVVINDYDKTSSSNWRTAPDGYFAANTEEIIFGTESGDLIGAGLHDDEVEAGGGDDRIWGGSGNDHIDGGAGSDAIYGGRGDDVLTGGADADVFVFEGDFHADEIVDFNTSAGGDRIVLKNVDTIESWSDLVNSAQQVDSDLVLDDGSGNILILRNVSLNDLSEDQFKFVISNEALDGKVDGTMSDDTISLGYVDTDGDTISNGSDLVFGYAGNDSINGSSGNDIVYGGDGDDDISATYGRNMFYGEAGNDYLSTGQISTTLDGGSGNDILNAVMVRSSHHILTGGSGADTFQLTAGSTYQGWNSSAEITDFDFANDTLLIADQQIDLLAASPVGMSFDFGPDGMTITYNDGETVFLNGVDIGGPDGKFDGSELDDYVQIGSTDAQGDIVTSGADLIYGYGGNDYLNANAGNDTVFGGDGDDLIYGVRGKNSLHGEAGNDTLDGGADGSHLFGGAGDDVLRAAMVLGREHVLTGGSGSDVFEFRATHGTAQQFSTVTDFDLESDTLMISGDTIDLLNPSVGYSTSEDASGLTVHYGDNDSVFLVEVSLFDFV